MNLRRPDRVNAFVVAIAAVLGLLVGCSSSGTDSTADAALEAPAAVASTCEIAAGDVIARFDEFLAPYGDLSPTEFLARPELAGLSAFQGDIAQIVADVAADPNDGCTEFDLEENVDTALQDYAGEGLLQQYLVNTVQSGVTPEKRDVVVSPEDELTAILRALGPGSSLTFTEGTFVIESTLLVQSDLVIVGAGPDKTVLASTAEGAAIAVLDGGSLIMNDLALEHRGDLSASVLISFDAPLELVNVSVSGAVADAEGTGGSGVVLTSASDSSTISGTSMSISRSVISDNAAAGIAVTNGHAPAILDTAVERNGQCGVCFFDSAAGDVQRSTLTNNGVGAQISGAASPTLANNAFVDNQVAGLLIEGSSTAAAVENDFTGPTVVGIDVQGTAAPRIEANTFGPHAVAISTRDESGPVVASNTVAGGEVALLVGGTSLPLVSANSFTNTTVAAMLHTEDSTGTFVENQVAPADGAGVVIEGNAVARHERSTVAGGIVGFVFREDSMGSVSESTLVGQEVGIEVGDNSNATVTSSSFAAISEAGMIFSTNGSGLVQGNQFTDLEQIAIQSGGSSAPEIAGNTITGGDTAILLIDSSNALVIENELVGQNFGMGVNGDAAVTIADNTIRGAASAALSFEGSATAEVRANTIVDAELVGIRIAGSADVAIEANTLFALTPDVDQEADSVDDGQQDDQADAAASSVAGLLYAEDSGGVAQLNQLFGFVISIQVSDSAAPSLLQNRADGAGVGGVGILYSGDATGLVEANLTANQQLGFQVSGAATPELVDNVVEQPGSAAFLIQGESLPSLAGNDCPATTPGIVVLEEAAPRLGDNNCAVSG